MIINILALPAREYILPEVAPKLMRSSANVKFDTMEAFSVWFAPAGEGNLLSAQRFDVGENQLHQVIVNKRNATGITTQRIEADRGGWDAARGGWQLKQATVRRWENLASSDGLDTVEKHASLFYPTDLSPEVLVSRRASNYPRFMSLTKLQSLKQNEALAGRLRVQVVQAIWSRFSLIVLNVLVLVMALPFFLRPTTGSLLAQAIKAAGIVLTIWGGGVMMLTMPASIVSPVVAVWLPVVICLPLAALLLQFVRT
jgi:lipopolysaccharide export LptBFGC system permease protein LptF